MKRPTLSKLDRRANVLTCSIGMALGAAITATFLILRR